MREIYRNLDVEIRPMAQSIVRSDVDDVTQRLALLGLEQEQLLQAARRWHFSWSSFTLNHPPIGIGISAWTEAVAALREELLPVGWTRSDERNYALVLHPDGVIAINVATGDSGTGRPDAVPSSKAPKGVSTADAISVNQQQLELDLPVPDVPDIRGDDGPLTWFLLLHRADGEIRSELSLPSAMSPDGRIIRWQERIILSPIQLDTEIEIEAPRGVDLDIEVKRKA
jgi:hypothetical protein